MITAVDTNVLLDLLNADREQSETSREAIRACLAEGSLISPRPSRRRSTVGAEGPEDS